MRFKRRGVELRVDLLFNALNVLQFGILGVIRSQSSLWLGRLIKVPDKDKDVCNSTCYNLFVTCMFTKVPFTPRRCNIESPLGARTYVREFTMTTSRPASCQSYMRSRHLFILSGWQHWLRTNGEQETVFHLELAVLVPVESGRGTLGQILLLHVHVHIPLFLLLGDIHKTRPLFLSRAEWGKLRVHTYM